MKAKEAVERSFGQVLKTKYERIVAKEMDRAEVLYNAGLTDASRVVQLAVDGGECLLCGKPWKKVDVKNIYAEFSYFTPDCQCYPKCIYCKRHMYEERHGQNPRRMIRQQGDKKEQRMYLKCSHCGMLVPISQWERCA